MYNILVGRNYFEVIKVRLFLFKELVVFFVMLNFNICVFFKGIFFIEVVNYNRMIND